MRGHKIIHRFKLYQVGSKLHVETHTPQCGLDLMHLFEVVDCTKRFYSMRSERAHLTSTHVNHPLELAILSCPDGGVN
jgi:hypothetical protein